MTKLPWVGWITSDGESHLSSWWGETKYVVVRPVTDAWHPSDGVPEGGEVLEMPAGIGRNEQVAWAKSVGGLVVIVLLPAEPEN